MKNKLLLCGLLGIAYACGGSATTEKEEVLSQEEETEIVETLNAELDEAQEALKEETEESLNEIDSLLENF